MRWRRHKKEVSVLCRRVSLHLKIPGRGGCSVYSLQRLSTVPLGGRRACISQYSLSAAVSHRPIMSVKDIASPFQFHPSCSSFQPLHRPRQRQAPHTRGVRVHAIRCMLVVVVGEDVNGGGTERRVCDLISGSHEDRRSGTHQSRLLDRDQRVYYLRSARFH
ncbi:hypothetical protein BC629DRAFT_808320 [Irpex lacteus]|nr:hypothetical protein BC629DRAFT_808320 [Irpex lacteus]